MLTLPVLTLPEGLSLLAPAVRICLASDTVVTSVSHRWPDVSATSNFQSAAVSSYRPQDLTP